MSGKLNVSFDVLKVKSARLTRKLFSHHALSLFFANQNAKSIANGDNFADAVNEICQRLADNGNSNMVAIGMNCVNPDIVKPLLASVERKVPFVVYPNSGEI